MRAGGSLVRRVVAAVVLLTLLAGVASAVDKDLRKRARSGDKNVRSDAAWDLASEGSPEAAKLLRALLCDEDTWVRDSTVDACVRLKNHEALKELLPLTRVSKAWKRWNAVEAIGRSKTPFAVPVLLDAIEDRDRNVRLAALGVLGWYGEVRGADAVALQASRSRDPVTRALAARSLQHFAAPMSTDRLLEMVDDPDPGVRAAAMNMLIFRDLPRALPLVPRFAAADDWRERIQAAWACAKWRSREAVDHLVALLRDERRVVAWMSHSWLVALTKLDYDDDPEVWDAWWKGAREGWTAPDPKARAAAGTTKRRYAQFHGLPITSDHIVFVIDDSTSMNKNVDPDGPEDGPTRWERTVEELKRVLAALPDGTRVNLIRFGETVRPVFRSPKPLDERRRTDLLEALEPWPSETNTNVWGAMKEAMAQDADTIYLLGDGAPNFGDAVMVRRVRRVIYRWNVHARRRIHTIAIGDLPEWAVAMMKGIAYDSGSLHAHHTK